jgi:hypothetical protein
MARKREIQLLGPWLQTLTVLTLDATIVVGRAAATPTVSHHENPHDLSRPSSDSVSSSSTGVFIEAMKGSGLMP